MAIEDMPRVTDVTGLAATPLAPKVASKPRRLPVQKDWPIWAIIAPKNEPSLRLAEKLGFELHSETIYHDDTTVVLKRPAW